jgi:hypothetical protein
MGGDFKTIKLSPNFQIKISSASSENYSKALLEQIERIWQEEKALCGDGLFNGWILNALSVTEEQLSAHFVEYKYYLAQIRKPELHQQLQLNPVSVSGYTHTKDHVLIGLRSKNVTEYKNLYELVPSGGIDKDALVEGQIDIQKQFFLELYEEAQIASQNVVSVRPFCMIYQSSTFHYELCAEIVVDPSMLRLQPFFSDEYTQLRWMPKSELLQFVEENKNKFVPLSLYLLKLF